MPLKLTPYGKWNFFGILEYSIIYSLPNVVTSMPVMVVGAELDGLKNSLANKEKEMVQIDQVINQLNTKIHQVRLNQSHFRSLAIQYPWY